MDGEHRERELYEELGSCKGEREREGQESVPKTSQRRPTLDSGSAVVMPFSRYFFLENVGLPIPLHCRDPFKNPVLLNEADGGMSMNDLVFNRFFLV